MNIMKKENKHTAFIVGDVISLREGDIEGHYIVIVLYEDGYVLVSTNGNKIRVVSAVYVDTHAKLLSTSLWKVSGEDQAERFSNTLAQAGISSENFSSTHETTKTSAETYNDQLVREHKELTTYLSSLYELKNKKYGDSFGKSIRKRGLVSAIVRMEDKWNRLDNLATNKEDGSDTDESLQDTLLDLANYCIMTVMELNHAKEHCSHDK